MKNDIRILVLEDNEDDIFLIIRKLQKSEFKFSVDITKNKNEFLHYFKTNIPDIVLSDYFLPDFNGLEALKFVLSLKQFIPFIIVTGTINEETAVNCIKAGADDYLIKDNLTRLSTSINSAIQKKNAEKGKINSDSEIRQIANELRLLIKTVNTPIFTIDKEGIIKDLNKSAIELFGFQKVNYLENHSIFSHLPEEAIMSFKELINKTMNGIRVINYELVIKSEEKFKKILVNCTLHRNQINNSENIVLIGQDITDMVNYREELERKINERTIELRKSLEKEKELGELRSQFISMVSHEFRTPLAAIGFVSGFLRKYKEKIDEDTYFKKLTKIDDQINHMTSLLDDVLIIGKVQNEKKFQPVKICLNSFFSEITEEILNATNFSHQIKSNNMKDSHYIYMDYKLGRNIFINLLSNAIKFSPGKPFIVFNNEIQNKYLVSTITDFGIGIPENELEHIFEPFQRASNTGSITGTGLGLSIVKEAVERHGGTISVSGIRGKETTFNVNLPLKISSMKQNE